MKLVIIVNKSWNLIKFRKDLIFFLKNNDCRISLVCEDQNDELDEFKKIDCDIYFTGSGFLFNSIKESIQYTFEIINLSGLKFVSFNNF